MAAEPVTAILPASVELSAAPVAEPAEDAALDETVAVPPDGIELLIKPPDSEPTSHYERSSFLTANVGDAVARIAPENAAAVGAGLALDADGVTLVATAGGRVIVDRGVVRIEQSMTIAGNVDFATGNIDYTHDVKVGGSIADLFRAHVGGFLYVRGVIEAADVRAGGGLRAAGGISGKGKGRTVVNGDVNAKYVANATLAATGNITTTMIAHSRVICGGKLTVTEGPTLAGHATATAGVKCTVLGSPAGVKTVVEAGCDETLRAAAVTKVPEAEALRVKAEKIRRTVEPLMRNLKTLNAQQKERATELLFEADEFETQANTIVAELRRAYDTLAARSKCEVVVSETLYSGVVIKFPGVYTVIGDVLQGPLRIATRVMHGETKIVLYYRSSNTAHSLPTHVDPENNVASLEKLLRPPVPANAVKK